MIAATWPLLRSPGVEGLREAFSAKMIKRKIWLAIILSQVSMGLGNKSIVLKPWKQKSMGFCYLPKSFWKGQTLVLLFLRALSQLRLFWTRWETRTVSGSILQQSEWYCWSYMSYLVKHFKHQQFLKKQTGHHFLLLLSLTGQEINWKTAGTRNRPLALL